MTYVLRVRMREQHEITVRGGQKVRPHRRRVSRWGKWSTVAMAEGPRGAARLYESARYQTYERAIFRGGKRISIEQIRTLVKELDRE